MSAVLDLVFAARPLLHIPIWSIFLVALHRHHELSGKTFDLAEFGLIAALSLMAAGTYYLNQVYDAASDLLNHKLGFLNNNILSERQLMAGFLICSLLSLGISAFYGVTTFLIFAFGFLMGYLYSVPPFSLKNRPGWGITSNAVVIGGMVSFSVMPEINANNAGLLGWDNPGYFILTVAGVYAVTTIPDREGDARTGKRTLAVVAGVAPTLMVAAFCLALSAALAYQSGFMVQMWLSIIAVIGVMAALPGRNGRRILLAAKLPILLLTILASVYFPLYGLFLVALVVATRLYYRRRFSIAYPQLA